MVRLFNNTRSRDAYWLAGAFDGKPNPFVDPALATWSEILGREQARLWLAARASDGRGR
jgi:predicted nucleic acid-binding protein